MAKGPVTSAVRVLRSANVVYSQHLFDYDRHPSAELAAEAIGVDPHHTAKTIVFTGDDGEGAIVVMHGDLEVSAKKLARILGVKTVRPATQRDAQRITGYRFGGTSPLGMKTDPPVFMQETLSTIDVVYVNGGSRGFLIGIALGTLAELTRARLVEVAVD